MYIIDHDLEPVNTNPTDKNIISEINQNKKDDLNQSQNININSQLNKPDDQNNQNNQVWPLSSQKKKESEKA